MCIFPGKHGRQPAHFHLRNFRWRVYDADQWRITVWLHRGQIWTQKCDISFNFVDVYRNNKYGMPAKFCIGGLRSPHHVALSSSLPRSIGRRPGLFYARLHEEGKRQVSVKNNIIFIIFRFIVCNNRLQVLLLSRLRTLHLAKKHITAHSVGQMSVDRSNAHICTCTCFSSVCLFQN